jgi:hypothetical protein
MPHSTESIFQLDNAILKILFFCHEAGKITYGSFFGRLLLYGFFKAERILFRLRAMSKKFSAYLGRKL